MNPRTTLQERYPEADFSIYFRFLDACRDTEKGLDTQEHHICPRKQFPEFIDEAENLMTLRIDDHDFAHKLLEAACGIKAPHTAFLEAQRESASRAAALGGRKGGHNGGSNSYARRTGVHGRSAEKMSKDGRKAALVMVEKKLGIFAPEMLGVGGRIAGKKCRDKKLGIFSLTHEEHREAGLASTRKRWHLNRNIVSASCTLCVQ
jgi:hypothetical protein